MSLYHGVHLVTPSRSASMANMIMTYTETYTMKVHQIAFCIVSYLSYFGVLFGWPLFLFIYGQMASTMADVCNRSTDYNITTAGYLAMTGGTYCILWFLAGFIGYWYYWYYAKPDYVNQSVSNRLKYLFFFTLVVTHVIALIFLVLPGYGIDLEKMRLDTTGIYADCNNSTLSSIMMASFILSTINAFIFAFLVLGTILVIVLRQM